MVGGPGTGKSKAISPINSLLFSLVEEKTIHLGSTNMTKASMLDQLNRASRGGTVAGFDDDYKHLNILSSELGTLTDAYSPALLSTLSTLYDNDPTFVEEKRSIKKDDSPHIRYPMISLITGTQPRYMTEHIPMTAWEQGFATRLWIEYIDRGISRSTSLFATVPEDKKLSLELIREFERLATLSGTIEFSKESRRFLDHFYLVEDRQTAPTHSLLEGFNERRALKLQKYAVLLALCLRSELQVEVTDLEQTLAWMLDAEARLVHMLEAIGTSADSEVIRAIYEFVRRRFETDGLGVTHAQLKVFVNNRGDINKTPKYIHELKDMHAIRTDYAMIGGIQDKTREVYYPGKKFTWK